MYLTGWFFIQLLPAVGFLLALFLLVHIIRSSRSPGNTFAWLLVIVLMPHVGVPLYILFGGRKVKKMSDKKAHLIKTRQRGDAEKQVHAFFFEDTGDELFEASFGNRLEVLSDGEDTFRELIKRLGDAEESIYITSYILGRDETGAEIMRVLTEKAAQGVHVCLLLDAVGTFKRSRSVFRKFREAGGRLSFFMPVFSLPFMRGRANLRNHRKIVIIDRKTGIVGGMNLATEYMGYEESDTRWCDLSLRVEGPAVDDLFEVFRSDWKFASGEDLVPSESDIEPLNDPAACSMQVMPSGPDVDGDFLHEAIVTSFFKAQKRIWIATPYFVPDEIVLKALCMAARRGVDVRILVPYRSNHFLPDLVRRGYLAEIQKAGGNILYYKPRMMHGKLILIDEAIGITGSANMDMRSLFFNYEIAFFIYTPAFNAKLEAWMEGLFAQSAGKKLRTSVALEFFEGIARLLAPLL